MDKVQEIIFDSIGYNPSPIQKEFHESQARFKFLGAGCFTEDLEVLTSRGWIRFSDLIPNEMIYTNGLYKNYAEYQQITGITKQHYEGDVYKLFANWNNLELVVTPDHRFPVSVGERSGIRTKDIPSFRTAENINKLHYNIFKSNWRTDGDKNKIIGNKEIPIEYFAAFMGLFLSEGNVVIYERKRMITNKEYVTTDYRVEICQTILNNYPIIEELLSNLPYNYYFNKCCNKFVIYNKDLALYCRQFGNKYNKFIPEDLKNADKKILDILWEYLTLGDGHKRKSRKHLEINRYTYWTVSKKLKDDIQEILVKMGYRSSVSSREKNGCIRGREIKSTVPCFCIERLYSQKYRFQNKTKEQYKGMIYCLSVPNETFFVRKEGKVFMTGNSRFGKSLCGSMDVLTDILKPNTRGWIVGPSYDQPSKEFRYIYEALVQKLGFKTKRELNVAYTTPGPQSLLFPWGSEVHTKSEVNSDSLLGEEVDWMILSEGSRMKEETFDMYLRARIGSRLGRVIVPTTPHGYNWLYKRFYLPAMEGDSNYWVKMGVKVTENPYFPKEEYDRAKKELPEDVFAEQYDGEFVAWSGLIFKRFSRQKHVIPPFPIPANWPVYCAIDPHPSTPVGVLWLTVDEYGTWYICHEMFIPDLTIPEVSKRLLNIEKKCPVSRYLIDPNAKLIDKLRGQTMSVQMQFRKNGIPCIEANNRFESAYFKINEMMMEQPVFGEKDILKPKLFVFNTCKKMIEEFESYTWENEKTGKSHLCDDLKYIVNDNPQRATTEQEEQDTKMEEEEYLRSMNKETGY